jgi:uncharacterized protein involved in oxidation of intracellular sulfur
VAAALGVSNVLQRPHSQNKSPKHVPSALANAGSVADGSFGLMQLWPCKPPHEQYNSCDSEPKKETPIPAFGKGRQLMKLGMIITQTDPETVFNALCLAFYSLEQDDEVRIFLSGKGVEIDRIEDLKFNVKAQAQKVLEAGGQFFACGTCLKLRNSAGSSICPVSSIKDHYEIVRDSDKVVTI